MLRSSATLRAPRSGALSARARRPAAPVIFPARPSAARSRRGALQVVAFRDAHRADQLLHRAHEFLALWMQGRTEGPSPRVLHGLEQLSDPYVMAEVKGLLACAQSKGVEGLSFLLSPERHPPGLALRHWHSRVCAANEGRDTVFCLLELTGEDTTTGEQRSCYQVLKLDLMYDDVALNVTRVTERGQWDVVGDDTAPLVEHEHQLQHMQQEQQAQASTSGSVWEAEGCAGEEGAPQRLPHECHARREVLGSELPVERIHALSQVGRFTKGLGPEQLMDHAAAWVSARGSTVPSARQALEPILAPDFRLWDAYGLLPLVCDVAGDRPREEGQQQQQQSKAVVMGGGGHVAPREAVYDILDRPKEEYDIIVTPIDMASSYTHNVVFTHWSASMVPRARGPAADTTAGAGAAGGAEDGQGRVMPIQQECIELDIFDSEGRLTDVWMFRDATDPERHLLMSRRQQLAQMMQQQGQGHKGQRKGQKGQQTVTKA